MGKINVKQVKKIIFWIVIAFIVSALILIGLDYWIERESAKSHTRIRINQYLQIKNTLHRQIKTVAHFTKEETKYLRNKEREYSSLSKESKENLDWKKQYYPKTPIYLLDSLRELPRLYNLRDIQLSVDLKKEIYEFYIPANTSMILGEIYHVEQFRSTYISFEFIDEVNGIKAFIPGAMFIEKTLQYKGCRSDMFNCKFVIDESTFAE